MNAPEQLPHAGKTTGHGFQATGVAPQVRHPPWLLYASIACAAALLIGLALGIVLARGHVFEFDAALLHFFRDGNDASRTVGPGWLRSMMIDITALGSGTVLTLVVLLAAGILMIERLWLTLILTLAGVLSGSLIVSLEKIWFARVRPDLVPHLVEVSSASFPSGHSANSAIVYLTIATLLFQVVRDRRLRIFVVAAAMLLVLAIGTSRVFLGVHYPSDVLGGWGFGVLWAAMWWFIGMRVRLQRTAEPASAIPSG